MNKTLKSYLNSFKEQKIIRIFLIDFVFFTTIYLLAQGFNYFLQKKSAIFQGRTANEIQQLILSAPQEAQIILTQLKSFMILFFIGLIFLIVFTVLFYSLTRAYLWNYLLKNKLTKKNYWKWNILVIVLIIPFIIYFFIALVIKLIITQLLFFINNQVVIQIINNYLILILFVIYLIFIFLSYYVFTKKYNVWESLGEAFQLIKIKFKELKIIFLFSLLNLFVISVILFLLTYFLKYQQMLLLFFNLILFLLFLAWLRVYLVKVLQK